MANGRFDTLDALRGGAIVWMTVFHFCFDLSYFGWTRQDFYADPFWTQQRTVIVSLFLFCAGVAQAVALAQGQGWARFWRRWRQVAAGALLVSIGSCLLFPRSFIYFGVLHAIAVMLIIVRLTAGWRNWLWPAGALLIAIKFIAWEAHGMRLAPDFLNEQWINWIGLIGRKPITEDYVPLVPWLGVMWWGMAAGQWTLRHRPGWLSAPIPPAAGWLSWLGRWSLSWYLLHQPVLLALVLLLKNAIVI